jgi:dihydrofolate reductase
VRKLAVLEFLTLDGVMQAPGGPDEDRTDGFPFGGWQMEYGHDEAQQRRRAADIDDTGEWLLGRRTYDIFAAFWPFFEPKDNKWAAAFNGRPKHVVSRTLKEPLSWPGTSLISEDVAARVAALKEQPGDQITVIGSGNLVQTLLAHDLVDEIGLTVYPLILGRGKRLFEDGVDARRFELVETLPGEQGALMTYYRRSGEPVTRS